MSDFSSYDNLKKEAEESGYHISDDKEFVDSLLDGINKNIERYGYAACPCRLASGNEEKDLDMICPCNYRDDDLSDYGACFCALYVTEDVLNGKKELQSIPDRRIKTLKSEKELENKSSPKEKEGCKFKVPIWRCKVCGYLCGKENPPVKCPICKASAERFEELI
ncbi:MAG: ferredoxin:glutaredoxin reductase [Methanobrevibacter sp.]|jgi:ferredoxin-thioredoxin reductase catalytic subunit|nr:ferredoxin:glutaredoxin reductase [Methanobrevibacter sp.]